jgi:hypothetical protein
VLLRKTAPAILSWACALLQRSSSSKPPRRPRVLSDPSTRRSSSHEVFRPFSVSPHTAAALLTEAAIPRPRAPSGFLDLPARSSAACLPALFHAGSAHGVLPFRAFLLSRGRTPSPAPLPSCRWRQPSITSLRRRIRRSSDASHRSARKPCREPAEASEDPPAVEMSPRASSPSGVCSPRQSATRTPVV